MGGHSPNQIFGAGLYTIEVTIGTDFTNATEDEDDDDMKYVKPVEKVGSSPATETDTLWISHKSHKVAGNTCATFHAKHSMPRVARYRKWCFTLNNYTQSDIDTLQVSFGKISSTEYVFQEELGDNETRHLQGCVAYRNAVRFSTLKSLCPRGHWEKCKDWNASKAYCSKLDTRNGSIFTNIDFPRDPLEGHVLYEWQKNILHIADGEPDDRTIYWFWEPTGNVGKTALCKHIMLSARKATYVSGAGKDILFSFTNLDPKPKIVLWDVPRSAEGYISYQAIESVKNGIFFSGKYESKTVLFNCPHVIIFANFEPDTSKLSEDRWNITKIL